MPFFESVDWNIILYRIATDDPTFTKLNVHGEVFRNNWNSRIV